MATAVSAKNLADMVLARLYLSDVWYWNTPQQTDDSLETKKEDEAWPPTKKEGIQT